MQQLTLRQRLLVASMLFGMFFGAGNLIFPASMGQLAGRAFGIIVVQAIRRLGVEEPGQVARNTVLAGLLSSLLMAVIYLLVTVVGAQSRGQFAAAANGGEALAQIAAWYFGGAGAVILAVTVTVAMWFNSTVLNDFLKDWAEVQRKLRQGEITEAEYFEWKICWPESADK